MCNLIRLLIAQAAAQHGKDLCLISFLDALQHIIEAAPLLTADPNSHTLEKFNCLSATITFALVSFKITFNIPKSFRSSQS